MLAKVIETEHRFNEQLPLSRTGAAPSAQLLSVAREWSAAVWATAKTAEPVQLADAQIAQGLQLAQKPVFICGVHRSGTTLLRDMLDGHRQLVVLPSEGTYYTNLEARLKAIPENKWIGYITREWLRRLANPINQAPYWLLGRSTNAASPYIDFARYVKAWWQVIDHSPHTQWPHTAIVLAYASCTNHLDAELWVDKTPVNERFVDRIWQEMPGAKIIHMIREPMATLASHKKMDPAGGLRQPLRNLKNAFIIAAEQPARNNAGFMLLRYEDLCHTPQALTAALADFLDIDPLHTLAGPTVGGVPSQANSSFNKNAEAGTILKPGGHHRQQKTLSRHEQRLIAAYVGKVSARLNYPLAKVGGLKKLYLLIRHRLLFLS